MLPRIARLLIALSSPASNILNNNTYTFWTFFFFFWNDRPGIKQFFVLNYTLKETFEITWIHKLLQIESRWQLQKQIVSLENLVWSDNVKQTKILKSYFWKDVFTVWLRLLILIFVDFEKQKQFISNTYFCVEEAFRFGGCRVGYRIFYTSRIDRGWDTSWIL